MRRCNESVIFRDGRRCGACCGASGDVASPMCNGSDPVGELLGLSKHEVQARCSADELCVGLYQRRFGGRTLYRPVQVWNAGRVFPLRRNDAVFSMANCEHSEGQPAAMQHGALRIRMGWNALLAPDVPAAPNISFYDSFEGEAPAEPGALASSNQQMLAVVSAAPPLRGCPVLLVGVLSFDNRGARERRDLQRRACGADADAESVEAEAAARGDVLQVALPKHGRRWVHVAGKLMLQNALLRFASTLPACVRFVAVIS